MWTLDFIAPSILCTTQGSECIPTSYPVPKGAVKIEADGRDPNQPQPPNKQDPAVRLQYLEGPVRMHFRNMNIKEPHNKWFEAKSISISSYVIIPVCILFT